LAIFGEKKDRQTPSFSLPKAAGPSGKEIQIYLKKPRKKSCRANLCPQLLSADLIFSREQVMDWTTEKREKGPKWVLVVLVVEERGERRGFSGFSGWGKRGKAGPNGIRKASSWQREGERERGGGLDLFHHR